MYIYPDNLKSKAVLWLWQLRDIGIIGVSLLLSAFALAQLVYAAYRHHGSVCLPDHPV